VDFFAIYLIPVDAWYIIPYEATSNTSVSVHFRPHSPRQKWGAYREAWDLLRGEADGAPKKTDRIFACVDEDSPGVMLLA